jgi:outer membrane protein OmpA-like peptidoglycan-associated protein
MKPRRYGHCRRPQFPVNLWCMRQTWILPLALACAGTPALAQVTVDLHALDALPGNKAQAPEPAPRLPTARRVVTAKPASPAPQRATAAPLPLPPDVPAPGQPTQSPTSTATTAPAATPPAATLPTAAPPTVALAPLVAPPPTAPTAPPPPPPISSTANSTASSTSAGLQVTFGTGQSDLSPASATAIQNLVKSAATGDGTSFNVVAYAAGTPDDPSTARRLSLARALAVRSALMAEGISSSRIYVRALGAPEGDKTPDRADVAVLGSNAPASDKSTQQ